MYGVSKVSFGERFDLGLIKCSRREGLVTGEVASLSVLSARCPETTSPREFDAAGEVPPIGDASDFSSPESSVAARVSGGVGNGGTVSSATSMGRFTVGGVGGDSVKGDPKGSEDLV